MSLKHSLKHSLNPDFLEELRNDLHKCVQERIQEINSTTVGLQPAKPAKCARVRQDLRGAYFYIDNCTTGRLGVLCTMERFWTGDDNRWKQGNYFLTFDEAERKLHSILNILGDTQ